VTEAAEDPLAAGWRERRLAGRAMRASVPRSAHADGGVGDRWDPIGILQAQAATRMPDLIGIRHARMAQSPWSPGGAGSLRPPAARWSPRRCAPTGSGCGGKRGCRACRCGTTSRAWMTCSGTTPPTPAARCGVTLPGHPAGSTTVPLRSSPWQPMPVRAGQASAIRNCSAVPGGASDPGSPGIDGSRDGRGARDL
jgi:hypothetical protein